jgi:hypothetical protein
MEVTLKQGYTLVYRVFDIGEEINLSAAEKILANQAYRARLKLTKAAGQALIIRDPPIRLNLGESILQIGGKTVSAELVATVWDYGVVSLVFQLPIVQGTTWTELVKLSDLLQSDAATVGYIDELARTRASEITKLLGNSLKRPIDHALYEDYVIFFIQEVNEIRLASELIAKVDIESLILGESSEALSERMRKPISEYLFQYAENDLAVVDWNSALVLEPSGKREVPDILEFALTHLLEFRFYDELLDVRMRELYDQVEARRQSLWASYFSSSSKEANTRFLEFSEFIERVDNSLKVVGDFYLAGIFRAAVRRFRLADWQQSVTRKLNLFTRVSELLQGELNVWRGHVLEFVVIFLIAFEIVSAILRSKI